MGRLGVCRAVRPLESAPQAWDWPDTKEDGIGAQTPPRRGISSLQPSGGVPGIPTNPTGTDQVQAADAVWEALVPP